MRDHRSWLTTPLLVQQEPKSGKLSRRISLSLCPVISVPLARTGYGTPTWYTQTHGTLETVTLHGTPATSAHSGWPAANDVTARTHAGHVTRGHA